MDREGYWSVSDLLNHAYCARITWWWHVAGVPQRNTTKTRHGRDAHGEWTRREGARRYEGVTQRTTRKRLKLALTSDRLGLTGRLDAVLHEDGRVIPWDAKNTTRPSTPWPGQRLQLAAYALLIEDAIPDQHVDYGVIEYLGDGTTERVAIDQPIRSRVRALLDDANSVRLTERLPPRAPPANCRDCVYAKICLVP